MDRVIQLTHKVRKALDEYALASSGYDAFSAFPHGCCLDSVYLLTTFLKNHGVQGVQVVSSETTNPAINYSSHAWIELNNRIIDITADQFNNRLTQQMPKVYISTNREWHDSLFSIHDTVHGQALTQQIDTYRMSSSVKPAFETLLNRLS